MKRPEPTLWRGLLDSLKLAVLLVDQAKTVRFMNTAAEDLLQISSQRAVGQDEIGRAHV